jgi:hypothetical protein
MRWEHLSAISAVFGRRYATPTDGIVAENLGRGRAALELKSLFSALVQPTQSWSQRQVAPKTHFSFRDRWRVDGRIEDVAETLLNTDAISSGWPQLAGVKINGAGHDDGTGRKFAARASGFLPYELAIDFRVVRVRFPEEFVVELKGDLCGHGGGRLSQDGKYVAIDFDLTVRIARPMLHLLSLVVRPALCAQHRWVMQQGELGLRKTMESRQRMGADV